MSTPSDPRSILRRLEQNARRRFGQHFLTRTDLVSRMVRSAGVKPGDHVIEIGPGLGILTSALLESGASVTAIELDRDLAAYLRLAYPDLHLIEADAAKVRWEDIVKEPRAKVVANLPYNVGTQVTLQLIDRPELFSTVAVMLQREVIDRILASPGPKSYGALSIVVQSRASARLLLTAPPQAFHPPPKVHSAVVRLDIYPEPQTGVPPAEFDRVVRAGFAQRRKTLRNSLGAKFGREVAEAALAAAGIDPSARAETLDLATFRALALAFNALELT